MGVAKQGAYTCEGSVDVGPLGGMLRGKDQISESEWSRVEAEEE